jgi:hypothetical protein
VTGASIVSPNISPGLRYKRTGTRRLRIAGSDLRDRYLLAGKSTAAGVIIDAGPDWTVTLVGDDSGVIDLSYLSGEDGSALPPLVLRNCVIDGELRLVGSHFGVLEMSGCEISRIDGDYCRVENHCRLTQLTPLAPGRRRKRPFAQIRLVGARMDGTVDFRGCRLVSPVEAHCAPEGRGFANRYALSLASARIAGRLLMDEDFSALGGVSLYQASIGSSLSLGTARLESRDMTVPALDGEEMKLGGSLNWIDPSEIPGPESWHVSGRLVLRRAEIGGECKFENCRWSEDGSVSLDGTQPDHLNGGIDIRHSRIGGQLRIEDGCSIARWVAPPSGRSEEDVGSCAFGASIDAWKASIGKGIRIEREAVLHGPLLLNDSEVRHGIIMRGSVRLPAPDIAVQTVAEAVDLADSRLSGLVRFDARLSGSLNLRRARIDGDVELHYLSFACPPLAPGCADDRRTGCASLLDLNSLSVTGGLHIGGISLDWVSPRQGGPSGAEKTSPVETIGALVRWCEQIRPPRWWEPEWIIGRLRKLFSSKRIPTTGPAPARDVELAQGLRLCLGRGREPRLVAGTADDLEAVADTTRMPSTSVEAEDLARTFLEQLFDDRGTRTHVEIGRAVRIKDGWRVAQCEYSSPAGRYRMDLVIVDEGKNRHSGPQVRVRPRAERQIPTLGRDHVPHHFCRAGPFVLDRPIDPDTKPMVARDTPITEAIAEYLGEHPFRPGLIDFRGLNCRRFDDDRATVWLKLGPQRWWRLLLEGIEFVHFDQSNPQARSKSAWDRESAEPDLPEPVTDEVAVGRRLHMLKAFAYPDKVKIRDLMKNKGMKSLFRWESARRIWRNLFAEYSYLTSTKKYAPQPFEVFSRAYFRDGERNLAIEVARQRAKLRWSRAGHGAWRWVIKRPVGFLLICTAVSLAATVGMAQQPDQSGIIKTVSHELFGRAPFVPQVVEPFLLFSLILITAIPLFSRIGPPLVGRLFDVTFAFGLRPRQALLTVLFCLFAGAVMANNLAGLQPASEIMADGRFPKTDAEVRAHRAVAGTASSMDIATAEKMAIEGCNVVKNDDIDKALYAFDVFVPLLDIRQECAFTIAKDDDLLRALRAAYAALGWIVVSLTILTFSGVLRRDLEG